MAIAPILLAAAAASPPMLKPIDRWVVSFDDEKCLVTRDYGTKENPITFALKPSPFRGAARLIIAEKGYGPQPGEQYPATLQMSDQPVIKTNLLAYGLKKFRAVAVAIPMEALSGPVDRVAVKGYKVNYVFETSNLAAVVAKIDECVSDLQTHWNADADGQRKVAVPAEPLKPLGSYFRSSDYPADAMRGRQEGRVLFSLLVDETGAVRDCSTFASSGVASLDTMSCYLLVGKAKFKPAADATGKPLKSVVMQAVEWRIAP